MFSSIPSDSFIFLHEKIFSENFNVSENNKK
jgi:hypothetical protein